MAWLGNNVTVAVCNKLLDDGLTQHIVVVQSTLENSNLLGKSKKFRAMGSSSYRELEAITENKEMGCGSNASTRQSLLQGQQKAGHCI